MHRIAYFHSGLDFELFSIRPTPTCYKQVGVGIRLWLKPTTECQPNSRPAIYVSVQVPRN